MSHPDETALEPGQDWETWRYADELHNYIGVQLKVFIHRTAATYMPPSTHSRDSHRYPYLDSYCER